MLLETKRLMATRLQAWFVYFTESLITYSLSIKTLRRLHHISILFNELFMIVGPADYLRNFLFVVSGSINKIMKSIVGSAQLKSRPYAGCVLRREKQML